MCELVGTHGTPPQARMCEDVGQDWLALLASLSKTMPFVRTVSAARSASFTCKINREHYALTVVVRLMYTSTLRINAASFKYGYGNTWYG